MVTMTYSNLSVKKVMEQISSRKMGQYVMLYLYDFFEEQCHMLHETTTLFTEYGKIINSHLGGDITFMTVYSEQVIEKWGHGYMGEKILRNQFSIQTAYTIDHNCVQLMKNLAAYFDVTLPALILLDAEQSRGSNPRFAKIEFGSSSAETMYRHIMDVIEAIRNNYGNFDRMALACNCSMASPRGNIREVLDQNGSLKDIVKYYMSAAHFTQKNLCNCLGIGTRQFRRYLEEWDNQGNSYPLPRETAIAMAFYLKLTPDQADNMFDAAMVRPVSQLALGGRDGVIRDCLKKQLTLEATNRELQRRGWPPVTTAGSLDSDE